jgi:phosphoribosylcarboxyaminoimidazole (NCAIR) mutase
MVFTDDSDIPYHEFTFDFTGPDGIPLEREYISSHRDLDKVIEAAYRAVSEEYRVPLLASGKYPEITFRSTDDTVLCTCQINEEYRG